jgi:hypothetical protein
MKTQEEIENMIQRLRAERDSLPEYNFFGDNNWENFNLVIDCLVYNWDEDQIYDLQNHEDEDDNISDETLVFLISGRQWLDGKIPDNELTSF